MAVTRTEIRALGSGNWAQLELEVISTPISGTNNSSVKASLYMRLLFSGSTINIGSRSESTDWITIDGTKYQVTNAAVARSSAGRTLLSSKTKTVAHDSTGNKTINVSASYTMWASIQGYYYNAVSFAANSIKLDTLWSAITPPTTMTWSGSNIRNSRVKLRAGFTLSWSGQKAGNQNSITTYYIDYYIYKSSGAVWVNGWKSTAATSLWVTMPEHTRGRAIRFRVRAKGQQGGILTGAATSYLYNNTLPAAPTVRARAGTVSSGTTSTTLSTVSATAGGGGLSEVYYNRDGGTSGRARLTTSTSLSLSLGVTNTFYCWTWDGLEYGPRASVSIYRQNVPGTPSVTYAARGGYTDAGYTGSHIFAISATLTTRPTKSSGTIYYEYSYGTGWKSGGTQSVSGTVAHSKVFNLLSLVPATNVFERTIRFRVRQHDGLEYTAWTEQTSRFYTGVIPKITNFYNNAAKTGNVSTTNDFHRNIGVTFPKNTAISDVQLYYSIGVSGTKTRVGGSPQVFSTNDIKISNATGPLTPGQTYHFWLLVKYPTGNAVYSKVAYTRAQVSKYPFSNLNLTGGVTSIKPIQNPNTLQTIQYTKQNLETYGILANSKPVITLVYGNQSRDISAQEDSSAPDAFRYNVDNFGFYPYGLNLTGSNSTHNPFNLTFNKIYNITITLYYTDQFGQKHSGTINGKQLNLTYQPEFDTWSTDSKIEREIAPNNKRSALVANESEIIYHREKAHFTFPRVSTRLEIPISYRLLYQTKGTNTWHTIRAKDHKGIDGALITFVEDVNFIPKFEERIYKIIATDGVNEEREKQFLGSLRLAEQNPPTLSLESASLVEGQPNLYELEWILPTLSGSATGDTTTEAGIINEGTSYTIAKLYLERASAIDFSIASTVSSEPILTTKREDLIVLEDDIGHSNLLSGVNPVKVSANLPGGEASVSDITYCRIILHLIPDSDAEESVRYAQTIIVHSNPVAIYPNSPTYRWRKNYLGINSLEETQDAVFEIQDTEDKHMIYLRTSGGEAVTIDLKTGQVFGLTIDGGEWT